MKKLGLLAALFLLVSGVASAAFLPDWIDDYEKAGSQPAPAPDPGLWEEYGFDEGESAVFKGPKGEFNVTAWRMRDATGGLAAYQYLMPADAQFADLTPLAVKSGKQILVALGNYVVRFENFVPTLTDLAVLMRRLSRVEQSTLPAFLDSMKKDGLVPGSLRYIGGPVALEKFAPSISPSKAAFHFGTEAQLGKFRSPKGELTIALFSYPTPHIAREQLEEFRKIPDSLTKRAGPLLAIVLDPPDMDEAEKLLARFNYEATISWNEAEPDPMNNPAFLLISIFALIGALLAAALIAGVGFGGFRVLYARMRGQTLEEKDDVIRLDIDR